MDSVSSISMAVLLRFFHAVLLATVWVQVVGVVQRPSGFVSNHIPSRDVAPQSRCGRMGAADWRRKRIVNGEETRPHQYPWMAAIVQAGRWNCGGSLLNARYVLTAGHCVDRYDKSFYTVLLGKHRLFSFDDAGEKVFAADEPGSLAAGVDKIVFRADFKTVVMEPAYLGNGFEVNDVALLRLDAPVAFSATIRPICLPAPGAGNFAGSAALVTGWGRLASGDRPARLHRAALRVLDDAACANSPLRPYLRPGMMCAAANPGAACRGDSGGPLVREKRRGVFELIGVVSWGIGCAEAAPGVFSRVTYFHSWMRDNMADAAPCSN